MTMQTIQVSESAYNTLLTQAGRLQISPEHLLEHLLKAAAFELVVEEVVAYGENDIANALAAVDRLTTLFADLPLDDLEGHLNDPMLALSNITLDLFPQ